MALTIKNRLAICLEVLTIKGNPASEKQLSIFCNGYDAGLMAAYLDFDVKSDGVQFETKRDLWQWLMSGGKIINKHGESGNFIYMVDGEVYYASGESADSVLFSTNYWIKL